MNLEQFGSRMQTRRRALHLTQGDIGKQTSTTKSYISALERATPHPKTGRPRQPDRELVVRLAVMLGDNVDDMLLLAGHSPHDVTCAMLTRNGDDPNPVLIAFLTQLSQQIHDMLARLTPPVDCQEGIQDRPDTIKAIAFEEPSESLIEIQATESQATLQSEETREETVSSDKEDLSKASFQSESVNPDLPGDPRWQSYNLDSGKVSLPAHLDFRYEPWEIGKTSLELPNHIGQRLKRISGLSRMSHLYTHRTTVSEILLYAVFRLDPRLLHPAPNIASVDIPTRSIPSPPILPQRVRWRTYMLDIGPIDLPVGVDYEANQGTMKISVQLPSSVLLRLRNISANHRFRSERVTVTDALLYALFCLDERLTAPPVTS